MYSSCVFLEGYYKKSSLKKRSPDLNQQNQASRRPKPFCRLNIVFLDGWQELRASFENEHRLQEIAVRSGIMTMEQYGYLKVLEGKMTVDEVRSGIGVRVNISGPNIFY